jgi:hypothetical protein
VSFNDRIDALLTAIADDDSDAVERALQIYDVNDIVAVMAKRLLDAEAAGGGGSLPAGGTAGQALIKASSTPGDTAWSTGLVFQLLTFVVNFDDPNFNDPNTGVLLWTPGAGDIISDLWVTITTAFAGADAAVLYIGGNIDFDGILTGTVDLIGLSAMSAFQDFTTGGGRITT